MKRERHGAPLAGAPVQKREAQSRPSLEETLSEYTKTRVVYARDPACLLVDAFRYCHDVRQWYLQKWGTASESGTPTRPQFFYFLSHYHSDHYTGLTSSWSSGLIYCTPATAALVQHGIGVARRYLCPLEYGQSYLFDLTLCKQVTGTAHYKASDSQICRVRLIPANHCPGAAIFVFDCPSPVGCVVHTGDLRYNGTLLGWRQHTLGLDLANAQTHLSEQCHALRRCLVSPAIVDASNHSSTALLSCLTPFYEQFIGDDAVIADIQGRVNTLFLDNTFCDPAFRFPTQWHSTQVVIECVRSLFLQCQGSQCLPDEPLSSVKERGATPEREVRVAVLIASYTIGKERVAFAIQEAFHPIAALTNSSGCSSPPFVPIHVTPDKHDTLSHAGFFAERFCKLHTDGNTCANADTGPRTVSPSSVPVVIPITLAEAVNRCDAGVPCYAQSHRTSSSPLTSRAVHTGRALNFDDAPNTSDEEMVSSLAEEEAMHRGVRYSLTIILVPFGALSYPLLSAACGGRTGRYPSSDAAHDSASPLVSEKPSELFLDIGEDMKLSLQEYDHVLAVKPTGWTKRAQSHKVSSHCTQLDIPYSEHCSFDELLRFVALLNPQHVIPTVSAEQFRKHEPLFVERVPRLSAGVGATQPLSRFWKPVKKEADESVSESHNGGSTSAITRTAGQSSCTKAANPFSHKASSSADGHAVSVSASLEARALNTAHPSLPSLHEVAPSAGRAKTGQRSLAAFGIHAERPAKVLGNDECSVSDDDCVQVVSATQVVFEISDDEDD